MLEKKVFKIISQIIDVPFEQINVSSSPEEFEKWDSFQHMNLILALEEAFEIRFTDDEIVQMVNAGIILEAVRKKAMKGEHEAVLKERGM